MILGILMFVICCIQLFISWHFLTKEWKNPKKNLSLVFLGLLGALWAGGIGLLQYASTAPSKYVGACLIEAGVLFGLAILPYHLSKAFCGGRRAFRVLLAVQLLLVCLILPLYLASDHIAIAVDQGVLSYSINHTLGFYLSISYKVAVLLLVLGMGLYAGQSALYKRQRRQAHVTVLCALAAGVLLLVNHLPGLAFSFTAGGFAQFGIFLLLCYAAGRFPSAISPASVTTYIQEELRAPIVVLAPDNTVQMVNSSGAVLLGQDANSLADRDIRECLHFLDDYQPICPASRANVITKYDAVTKSGVLCELAITYIYDHYGEVICAIILMTDVSGQVQMIHQLEESRRKAEMANKAKSAFLANTSHEIRTPMNAIVGLAELLTRESLPPAAIEYVLGIRQASDSLLSIINDLLDFSKIESGKMEIVPVEYHLASLLNDVISIVRMRLADRPVLFAANVDCNLPSMLYGDEVRLRQILLNLLNNAAKYTREGHIILTVKTQPGPGQADDGQDIVLSFEIEDTGSGIREENKARMFEDFVRFDTKRNRAVEGTGLGLAISKQLCLAMGGDIAVESEYGKGSTFTLTLPQKMVDGTPMAQVENPAEKDVLLLESREVYAQSVAATVAMLGVPCRHVRTQAQFFRALRSHPGHYVFVPTTQLSSARRIMERIGINAQLVLLTEFGEVAAPEVNTIAMPAYCVSVAEVLNGTRQTVDYRTDPFKSVGFVAPEARLLVVDDIYTNLKVAEGLMAPYRMQVDVCQSGEDAVAMVLAKEYDIVFMDHMMPEMDGVEATQIIRRQGGRFAELPIVALTANAVSGMKDLFLRKGMNDFLAKPIDTAKLNTVLDQWLPAGKKQKYTHEPQPVPESLMLRVEGLNTEQGLYMAGGIKERYIETLRIFVQEIPAQMAQISQAIQAEEYQRYIVHVHALKSALAAVGALELSDASAALERAGGQKDTAFMAAHTGHFLARLGALLASIQAALPKEEKPRANAASAADMAALPQALNALRQALELMDAGEVEKNLAQLRQKAWPSQIEAMLNEMETCTRVYNYSGALALLETPA